jgi:hypothetical protein
MSFLGGSRSFRSHHVGLFPAREASGVTRQAPWLTSSASGLTPSAHRVAREASGVIPSAYVRLGKLLERLEKLIERAVSRDLSSPAGLASRSLLPL